MNATTHGIITSRRPDLSRTTTMTSGSGLGDHARINPFIPVVNRPVDMILVSHNTASRSITGLLTDVRFLLLLQPHRRTLASPHSRTAVSARFLLAEITIFSKINGLVFLHPEGQTLIQLHTSMKLTQTIQILQTKCASFTVCSKVHIT